jgi:predicted small lipoprotein YifL
MRYRLFVLMLLALSLVAVLSACGGKGGGGY